MNHTGLLSQDDSAFPSSSSHLGMLPAEKHKPTKASVQEALDANKRLQLILAERAEKLEAELKEVDGLLEAANTDEGDEDPEAEILIPGAKKAAGLLASSDFLNASSPFYNEAKKRSTYLANTTPHPMKPKDLEVLADAVRQENQRIQAYSRLNSGSQPNVVIDLENNLEGLDWARISEKVSDASSVKRTPTECRVTWIGGRHPRINHAEWSTAEIKKLETIVSDYVKAKQPVDWVKVAEKLGTNRTPIDCMKHGFSPQRHAWSPESDKKLTNAVETCGIDNWQLVAKHVSEYVTASQCQARWQKTLDPGIKRGGWTEEEDERLRKAVAGYGKSWVQVSTAIAGRTNDQCRERWTEHINISSDKMTWSEEEDKHLLKLVEEIGNQWKFISLKLGGNKTGQHCRIRYDKLKRASKSSKKGTSSLSVVSSPLIPAIPNLPGPSQSVHPQVPEATSTVFTFAPSLGQHSFVQPSISPSRDPPAVIDPLPNPQPVDTDSNAEDVASTGPSGISEQILDSAGQSGLVAVPLKVPKNLKKSEKKVSEASQTTEVMVSTTKPRPKPRRKASAPAKVATPAPSEAVDQDIPVDSPLTDLTSSTTPLASDSSTKGTKRKAIDRADLAKTRRPTKKPRISETAISTAPEIPTEIASDASGIPSSSEPPATKTQMLEGLNSTVSSATESAQPELRRGRSRKLVTEPMVHAPVDPEPSASVTPGDPPPKRPRGRPRKLQTTA